MIPRYSHPEMTLIWEPKTRFQIWFDIERYACEAQEELGVIPRGIAEALAKRGKFELERINVESLLQIKVSWAIVLTISPVAVTVTESL